MAFDIPPPKKNYSIGLVKREGLGVSFYSSFIIKSCNNMRSMCYSFFVICVVFYLFMFSIASASALLNLEAITMRIKQSATKI